MVTRAPTPALYQALNNWQQRAQIYSQLGIPQAHWYQIAVNDIQNVANTGAAPMATTDVNAAMASQLAGRTLVGDPVHHSHGLFGDIWHSFTSIPSDVGHLLAAAGPGAAHFVRHFPSEVTGTAELFAHGDDPQWLTAHGYEDPRTGKSGWGQAAADLRNIAHSPILSLVPGVADAANLTTGAGRQYLLSHPVTAALDVIPAGKVAGLGARGAVAAGLMKAGEEGSAREAVLAGRPLRAVGRTVIPASKRARIVVATNTLGVGDAMKAVFRDRSTLGREWSRKIERLVSPVVAAMEKLSPEVRKEITDQATGVKPRTGEYDHYLAEIAKVRDALRGYGQDVAAETKGKSGLIVKMHGKTPITFAADQEITVNVRRMSRLLGQVLPRSRKMVATALKVERQANDRVAKAQAALDAVKARAAQTMRPEGRRIAQLESQLAAARKAHERPARILTDRIARHKRLQANLAEHRNQYNERMQEMGGSAEMGPMRDEQLRAATSEARTQMTATELQSLHPLNDPTHPLYDPTTYQARVEEATRHLAADLLDVRDASTWDQMEKALIDPAERKSPEAAAHARELLTSLKKDVIDNVMGLVAAGLDPLWLRHVDPGREARYDSRFAYHAHILPDRIPDITQYNKVVWNLAPRVDDIALGMSSAAVDLMSAWGTREFLGNISIHFKTNQEVDADFLRLARDDINARRPKRPATRSIAGHADVLKAEAYTAINPNHYGLAHWGGVGRFRASDQLLAPNWLATNLEKMLPKSKEGIRRIPLKGAYDAGLGVFRFSVLTGPRHFVHRAIAGLLPLMLQQPFAPIYFRQALQIMKQIKEGDHEKTFGTIAKKIDARADGFYTKAVGSQLRMWVQQLWRATGARFADKLAHMEDSITDMYRISAALANKNIGRMGLEEAINKANKVAVDMDDMHPLERTVIKNIVPFYAYTKFLFRFLLTYPVDHPVAASIISRFAAQEQADWNSMIPEKFMMTMFIGQPDSHGNIKTVDLRNLNPFRSFANDMTLAGFFQQLNPIAAAALYARGFDPLTASGPLYPSLEFNPNSGTLQAAPPTGRDQAMNAISQFIPELSAVDHFVGLTDRMRVLKKSNPAAFEAQLYSSLNVPGVFAPPITVNLPYVEAKAEMARYKNASSTVSAYEEGKPAPYKPTDWTLVPYQGQYVDPAAFEQYWQSLIAGAPAGINPKAITSTPIRKTSQDPLELLAGLSTLPAPPPPHY